MSPFLGFCEGYTRNRWRDGQVCPDVDKELWRLVPDGSGVFWRGTSVSRCGQGTMAEVKGTLVTSAIRRSRAYCEHTPTLVFKRRVLFFGRQEERGREKMKKRSEKEGRE
ncbi:hypothetical protein TNCV_31601 [Trichonephila clavipes]|nr:hypothetical protein TNCV_31601 [Trichonephila clavipes]